MWSSRLFWKLFVAYAGLNLLSAAAFVAIVSGWQKAQMLDAIERRLHDTAIVLARQFAPDLGNHAANEMQSKVAALSRETGARITIVALDGTVVADSHENASEMANHKNRPELIEALSAGTGLATRSSPTLGVEMLYSAVRSEQEGRPVGLVRTALPMESIQREIAATTRLILSIALAVTVATLALTYGVVAHIIRPLANLTGAAQAIAAGDYRQHVEIARRDELGLLGEAFNGMSRELGQRVAQMRETGDRLATVLGSMAEGVVAVDHQERVILANKAAGALLDFDSEAATGRPLLEVVRSRALHEAVERTLAGDVPPTQEFEPAGSPRRVLALGVRPLPGQPRAGVLLVLRDVSELRRLENLRHEFIANVSHELKTPLTSIKAYAETLREGAIHDAEHNIAFVERIEEQAERLYQLILDMLSLARIESGQEALDVDAVPLDDVVTTSIANYASMAAAKQITIETIPGAQAIDVHADKEGLRQILDNLIDNAVKYTPTGGRVVVRWHEEAGMAVIEVEDTGIGIDPADQARIFERFYRVDKARSRELGGTGLGLSIVKHLAQAFGGGVSLRSQLGEGTTFTVRLPLAAATVGSPSR